MALAYYRWERVVQDLIECAKDVCFRDDLGAETKAEIARLFQETLEGRNLAAAYATMVREGGKE